jgi:hypothetical protein
MNTKRYKKVRKRKTRRIMRGGGGHFLNFLKSPTTAPRPSLIVARQGSVLAQVLYLCRKKCNEMELSKEEKNVKKNNKAVKDIK